MDRNIEKSQLSQFLKHLEQRWGLGGESTWKIAAWSCAKSLTCSSSDACENRKSLSNIELWNTSQTQVLDDRTILNQIIGEGHYVD